MSEADEPKPLPPTRKIVRTPAENFQVYYANNSEIGMTTWDLSIRFGRISGADSESLRVQDLAVITMSLHHAKALAMILSTYIKQYEKENGRLAVPFGTIGEAESREHSIPTSMFQEPEKEKEKEKE